MISKNNKNNKTAFQQKIDSIDASNQLPKNIPSEIEECEQLIKNIFNNSSDIIAEIFQTNKKKALIVYIDGLTNKDITDRDIIAPLKSPDFNGSIAVSINAHYKETDDIQIFIKEVIQGNTAIFYDKKIYIIDFKQWDKRAVDQPDEESVTRGPREAFTETYRSNTSLLRRKIRTPNLIIENMILGKQSNTQIGIAYIKGIVNEEVLNELKIQLSKIDTDAILESGNIEQLIEKNTFSPIPCIGSTLKPDVAAARILEGRVAVFCDGTPHVLTMPSLFIENLQTSEDYYNRFSLAFIQRFLRFIGLFITIFLPGLSVAIITYNPEMMPSVFLTSLIASTQKTPMPIGAELFFLILMFELLKEAGTRLPKTIGSAITIVGALIIGEAAVTAGIVSAPCVIIVALTAVTSFLTPNLIELILIYRILLLFLGIIMGLFGIAAGIFIMLTNIISTESFGIPVLSSFSKYEKKDSIIRFPLWSMLYRPVSLVKNNIRRFREK